MNPNVMTWFVLVISIAILFLLLFLSRHAKRKLGLEPPASKLSAKFVLLSITLLGALVGSFFSSVLNEENMWLRLLYSLILFFIIGVPEVLMIRKIRNKLSSIYLLDGETFPFFAIGFSCAMFLLR